jgi:chromosome condensin MukBEF MukE localization factor
MGLQVPKPPAAEGKRVLPVCTRRELGQKQSINGLAERVEAHVHRLRQLGVEASLEPKPSRRRRALLESLFPGLAVAARADPSAAGGRKMNDPVEVQVRTAATKRICGSGGEGVGSRGRFATPRRFPSPGL